MALKIVDKHERPWGWYENLLEGEKYKVKKIVVFPAQQISLQYHYHREEHWTVVEGSGYVTIGEEVHHATVGKNYIIPVKKTHRLYGDTNGITIIEVQLGDKCIEEDIVRLQDDYDRI